MLLWHHSDWQSPTVKSVYRDPHVRCRQTYVHIFICKESNIILEILANYYVIKLGHNVRTSFWGNINKNYQRMWWKKKTKYSLKIIICIDQQKCCIGTGTKKKSSQRWNDSLTRWRVSGETTITLMIYQSEPTSTNGSVKHALSAAAGRMTLWRHAGRAGLLQGLGWRMGGDELAQITALSSSSVSWLTAMIFSSCSA